MRHKSSQGGGTLQHGLLAEATSVRIDKNYLYYRG